MKTKKSIKNLIKQYENRLYDLKILRFIFVTDRTNQYETRIKDTEEFITQLKGLI